LGIETLLLDKLPEALDQIQIRRVGREEKKFNMQLSGQPLDEAAVLIAGIIQNKGDGQIGKRSCQLIEQSGHRLRVNVTGVGDSYQLSGGGVQGAEEIEALPARKGFDKKPDKGSQETKKRLQDKMGRIHEKQMTFVGLSFVQTWPQLLIDKFLLFLRVHLGWYRGHLTPFQPQLLKKHSHLGWTATQARQFFDTVSRLINGGRWPLLEFLSRVILMVIQITLGLVKVQFFEGFNPSSLMHLEILTQRRLANPHNATNFLVGQTECLQVHRFHSLTHSRMRMPGAFLM
jgi:hypothetical protein